mmetsp:Transcript_22564/g.35088  ORF Transcript_22564/g.35088 Transcript_22564/m.35088 type:complete len:254 (-) Transcript_22564:66-827(-)
MMMLFLSVDDVGKVDTSLLPDQTLMELFIGSSQSLEAFQNADGDFQEFSSWTDVLLDTDGRPTKIYFDRCPEYKGLLKMRFEFIPSSVWLISFELIEYQSTLEFSTVPGTVRYFNGWRNRMYGTVDLTSLPGEIRVLSLGRNSFSGTLDFTMLPLHLDALELRENSFSGTIDLRGIERCISSLNHDRIQAIQDEEDELPGKDDLGIDLQRNNFEGDIFVRNLKNILKTEPFRFLEKSTGQIIDAQGRKCSVQC